MFYGEDEGCMRNSIIHNYQKKLIEHSIELYINSVMKIKIEQACDHLIMHFVIVVTVLEENLLFQIANKFLLSK